MDTCMQTGMEIEVGTKVTLTKLLAKYLNGGEWDLKWRLANGMEWIGISKRD